jgi:hypothetical protein
VSRSSTKQPRTWISRRWRRLLILVLAPVFALLTTTGQASGYALEGLRWHGTPTSGCCAYIHVQFNTFSSSNDRSVMTDAMNAWTGSPANVILQALPGNLTVEDTTATEPWVGATFSNPNWGSTGSFVWVHVVMSIPSMNALGYSAQKEASMHELGHAMGIDHTYGCIGVMEGTATFCGYSSPSSDDVAGINALY